MAYLISYDLLKAGKDYKPFHEAIKEFGSSRRNLGSVWITTPGGSCSHIRDTLAKHIDDDDRLLVLELKSEWAVQNLSQDSF